MPSESYRSMWLVAGLLLVSCTLFLTLNANGNWDFILPLRATKLASLLLVAYAVGVSTLLFQTLTNNPILTPSILGFDALYIFLQTLLVAVLGGVGYTHLPPLGKFGFELAAMVGGILNSYGRFAIPALSPILLNVAMIIAALWGAPLARYAAWRRAGDFIFLSGIIPVNPLNGTIVNGFQDVPEPVRELLGATGEFSTDAKQGPILAQSWYVLESIRRTGQLYGDQLRRVFLADGDAVNAQRTFVDAVVFRVQARYVERAARDAVAAADALFGLEVDDAVGILNDSPF